MSCSPTSLRRRCISAPLSSRSRLLRISLRNCSGSPDFTPKLRMNAPSTSGSTGSDTSSTCMWTLTVLPANSVTRQSAGKSTSTSFSSPGAMPMRLLRAAAASRWNPRPCCPSRRPRPAGGRRRPRNGSPSSTRSFVLAPRARRAFQLWRCMRRLSIILSMSASLTWRCCGSTCELPDVDVAEVRHHFERGDVGEFALARGVGALFDLRVARQAQRVLADDAVEALARASRRGSRRAPGCRSAARSPWSAPCRGGSP